MSQRAQELIGSLRNFRARKEAMEALIALGDEAVPALVEALGDRMENVRWSARQVLAQIGGDTVVAHLMERLDDPQIGEAAAQVVKELTGKPVSTGQRAAPTREAKPQDVASAAPSAASEEAEQVEEPCTEPEPHVESEEPAPAPEAEAPPEALSDEELVREAVEGSDISVGERTGGFVLTVPIERGRSQKVTVSFSAHDFQDEPLVVVYTECGPAESQNYEWALRQNLRMSFGAIGVRDRAGQPTFVMVNTHLRSTARPADLRKSILLLAERGDKLEEALTKSDER